jgi:hypothetical protein
LPPNPIITRWGSWIEAALYFGKNFDKICNFVDEIKNDSKAIKKAKTLYKNPIVKAQLENIKVFDFMNENIKIFQTSNLSISEQLNVIENVKIKLKSSDFALRN